MEARSSRFWARSSVLKPLESRIYLSLKWPTPRCKSRRRWVGWWVERSTNPCFDPSGRSAWRIPWRTAGLKKERPHVSQRCWQWWPAGRRTTSKKFCAPDSQRTSTPVSAMPRLEKVDLLVICSQKKPQHCSGDSPTAALRSDLIYLSVLAICV